MSKKLGDVAIAITILLFCVGGITLFMNGVDTGLGVSSSVSSDFTGFTNDLDDAYSMQDNFYQSIDNASTVQSNPDAQSDEDTSAGGVLNLFSKNILVQFFKGVANKLEIPGIILTLILSIIGISITVLIIRSLLGDSKW